MNGFRNIRSSSVKNLDSFFNALSSLIGLTFLAGKVDALLTALSVGYQRLQSVLIADPARLISELKTAQKAYFEYIRGGPNPVAKVDKLVPEAISTALETPAWSTLSQSVLILHPFISLRTLIYGDLKTEELLTYDRIVMAFLAIHRLIVLPAVVDYTSITDPTVSDPKEEKITDDEIRLALHNLGINPTHFKSTLRSFASDQQHEIFSTSGPNGPATWTAYTDAVAILNNLNISSFLHTFAEKSGMIRFWNDMVRTVRLDNYDPVLRGLPILGKIYTFEEWGGKTRNVAILDYWTQIILTPLHNTIFHYLKTLSTDATFNQDAASEAIRQWTLNPKAEINSVDLTAATDRLPLSLQEQILGILLSDRAMAHAWGQILVARPFETQHGGSIYYAVGQPMGARSSWAMLALTHHIIIQIAAIRAKTQLSSSSLVESTSSVKSGESKSFPQSYSAYKVCGDDSVIVGQSVLSRYLSIMNGYGVAVNMTKSVLFSSSLLAAAEFCKRMFIAGFEYTSISPKLVIKTTQNGRLGPILQNDLLKRGFFFPGSTLLSWIAGLIDEESLNFLVLMNLLPTSVTGLLSKATLPENNLNISTMFNSTVELKENDYIQAYTYTAAVGQLKRLDALLQQTSMVNEAIQSQTTFMQLPTVPQVTPETPAGLVAIFEQLSKVAGQLSRSHPVVQAAFMESNRVTSLLAQLSTGTTDLGTAARTRLLDMVRNALASAWQDPQAARAQADRSLLQGALTSLGLIVAKSVDFVASPKEYGPPVLSFTTLLAHVRRLWTINWRLGETVRINSVKSNVTASSTQATNNLATVVKGNALLTRFTSTPKSSKNSPQDLKKIELKISILKDELKVLEIKIQSYSVLALPRVKYTLQVDITDADTTLPK